MNRIASFLIVSFFSTNLFGMHPKGKGHYHDSSLYVGNSNSRTVTRINKDNYKVSIGNKSFLQSAITKKHKDTNKAAHSKNPFIYDSYTDRRGEPKMLKIFCNECNECLMHYQKDGPGRLLRCYLDRIHSPEELQGRQYSYFNVKTSSNLVCNECFLIIGMPMIYESENRPAYQMIKERFYFKALGKV